MSPPRSAETARGRDPWPRPVPQMREGAAMESVDMRGTPPLRARKVRRTHTVATVPLQGCESLADAVRLSQHLPPALARLISPVSGDNNNTDKGGINQYECVALSPGIAVHKWWEGRRDAHGRLLAGKPNVWARKVVRLTPLHGCGYCIVLLGIRLSFTSHCIAAPFATRGPR